jgi:hypothetical protein
LELCADVDETAFASLGARPDDLAAFHAMGLRALRVDGGYGAAELACMSENPWGLVIEVNASLSFAGREGHELRSFLHTFLSEAARAGRLANIRACHNFFPLVGTGLDLAQAVETNRVFHGHGIPVGGFVASQAASPLLHEPGHGLPTIEAHRWLPPYIAAAELIAAGFDYVTIGDCPASPEELKGVAGAAVAEAAANHPGATRHPSTGGELSAGAAAMAIPVVLDAYADRAVARQLFGKTLVSRTDQPAQLIRATGARGMATPPGRIAPRPAYTVTVCNERAGRYLGELQIALVDLGASNEHNIAGFVHPEAARLLPYICAGARAFRLVEYGAR